MAERIHRFAVDRTLGRLARKLRMLGFDTLSECDLPRRRFEGLIGPERNFLTRNRREFARPAPYRKILIQSDRVDAQVIEVLRVLRVQPAEIRPFRLCLLCNVPIEAVDRGDALGEVPDYVWETREIFSRCPRCRRIYWRGSHTERALREAQSWIRQAAERHRVETGDNGPGRGFPVASPER
ncbi:MAG: Mut7-C RNAse domain-containing protein [Desulfobacterales bacterium]